MQFPSKIPCVPLALVAEPPPVIIEGNDDWIEVRRYLKSKNAKISKAKILDRTTKVYSHIPQDVRSLTKELDAKKCAYYTHTPNEDKMIHAVIRGLPPTQVTDIQEELRKKDLEASEVS